MPFAWTQYYLIAQHLVTLEGEGWKRSAVSRAYYAAFHQANRIYQQFTGRTDADITHSHYAVWKWFQEHPDRRYQKIGDIGFTLKRSRQDADYADEYPGLKAKATLVVERAGQVLDALGALARGSER